MKKLLLKETVQLDEAAKLLSLLFEEDWTESDLLQLVLERKLKLSILLLRPVHVRRLTRLSDDDLLSSTSESWKIHPSQNTTHPLITLVNDPFILNLPKEFLDAMPEQERQAVLNGEKALNSWKPALKIGDHYYRVGLEVEKVWGLWGIEPDYNFTLIYKEYLNSIGMGKSSPILAHPEIFPTVLKNDADDSLVVLQRHPNAPLDYFDGPTYSKVEALTDFLALDRDSITCPETRNDHEVLTMIKELYDEYPELMEESDDVSWPTDGLPCDSVLAIRTEHLKQLVAPPTATASIEHNSDVSHDTKDRMIYFLCTLLALKKPRYQSKKSTIRVTELTSAILQELENLLDPNDPDVDQTMNRLKYGLSRQNLNKCIKAAEEKLIKDAS